MQRLRQGFKDLAHETVTGISAQHVQEQQVGAIPFPSGADEERGKTCPALISTQRCSHLVFLRAVRNQTHLQHPPVPMETWLWCFAWSSTRTLLQTLFPWAEVAEPTAKAFVYLHREPDRHSNKQLLPSTKSQCRSPQ